MTTEGHLNKIIILVVEDDDITYMLIQEIISSMGMKAVRATSKPEVLELIRSEENFQMIVMDIILNGSDNGYNIAKELAAMHVDLPIMVVSAYTTAVIKPSPDNMRNIKEIMDKPFNIENFKKLLLKTLNTL